MHLHDLKCCQVIQNNQCKIVRVHVHCLMNRFIVTAW